MTSVGSYDSGAAIIDRVMGNAYQVVKYIYENFADIATLADHTADIELLVQNIQQADGSILAGHTAIILAGVQNFRQTFAEALVDFPVGMYFTTAESGVLRLYKRVVDAPGYLDMGDNVAPVARSAFEGTDGATFIGTDEVGINVQEALTARVKASILASTAGAGMIGTSVVDTTVEEAIGLLNAGLSARPTSAVLAAVGGADLIGVAGGGSVEDSLGSLAAAIAGTVAPLDMLFTDIDNIAVTTDVFMTKGYSVEGKGTGVYISDTLATSGLAAAHPRFCVAASNGKYFRLLPNMNGEINIDAAGAAADGVTDDYAAITAAYAYAKAIGVAGLAFSSGKTYYTGTIIPCGSFMRWNGNRATLKSAIGTGIWGCWHNWMTQIGYVQGDIYGPTNQLTLDTVAGLAVGDYVCIELGTNPWDAVEPIVATTARVMAIDGLVIELDYVIDRDLILQNAWTYTLENGTTRTVSAASNANKSVRKVTHGVNVEFNGFNFEGVPSNVQSVGELIVMQGGYNVVVNDMWCNYVSGKDGDAGAGAIGGMMYVRNMIVNGLRVDYSKNGRNQASLGRAVGISNCHNVQFNGMWANGCEGNVVFIESFCQDVTFRDCVVNVQPNLRNTNEAVFFVGQGSQVHFENTTVYNNSNRTVTFNTSGGTDSYITCSGYMRWVGTMPLQFPDLTGSILYYRDPSACAFTGTIVGNQLTVSGKTGTSISLGSILAYEGSTGNVYILSNGTGTGGDGTYTLSASPGDVGPINMVVSEWATVDFRKLHTATAKTFIYANQSERLPLGGPAVAMDVFLSANVDTANTSIYASYDSTNSAMITASLAVGQLKEALQPASLSYFGFNYGGLKRLAAQSGLLVNHNATVPPANAFVGVRALCAQVISTSYLTPSASPYKPRTMSDDEANYMLSHHKGELRATASNDFASIAAEGSATLAVGVTGAKVGDVVVVTPDGDLLGLILSARVSATNTVTIKLQNHTAGAIDLATMTFNVSVWRRGA